MIGRLLCALGRHKWAVITFRYARWTECERCEEVKDES